MQLIHLLNGKLEIEFCSLKYLWYFNISRSPGIDWDFRSAQEKEIYGGPYLGGEQMYCVTQQAGRGGGSYIRALPTKKKKWKYEIMIILLK